LTKVLLRGKYTQVILTNIFKYLEGTNMAERTFEKVQQVLVDGLGVSPEAVTLEATINDDLGADSLDAVEIIMSLEEEFDLEIEAATAETLITVGDIVALVDSLKA
jgi:acyl carrier protein